MGEADNLQYAAVQIENLKTEVERLYKGWNADALERNEKLRAAELQISELKKRLRLFCVDRMGDCEVEGCPYCGDRKIKRM